MVYSGRAHSLCGSPGQGCHRESVCSVYIHEEIATDVEGNALILN